MGGPWREKGYDPVAWKPPRRYTEATATKTEPVGGDRLTAVVVGYVTGVVLSFGVLVTLLKLGW